MDSERLLVSLAGCVPACPACSHRHVTAEVSEGKKMDALLRILGPLGSKLASLRVTTSGGRLAYREQVTLAAFWEEHWKAGLRKRDEIIPVPRCPVHAGRVNDAMSLLLPALPPPSSFPLAYVVQSGQQLSLVLKTPLMPSLDWLSPALVRGMESIGIQGLWLHLHPATGKKVFGKGGWHLIWGRERSLDRDGLLYGPTSFRQLIPSLSSLALNTARDFLDPNGASCVVDLYCGIGYSLRAWLSVGAACAGVEWNGEALECAMVNAPGAFVLRGLCHQRIPQLNDWLDLNQPCSSRLLYVNPPRTGLDNEVKEWITSSLRPVRIAYLSCSPGTLKRDLIHFGAEGYHLHAIIPFDFFPQTHHVECLSLLYRS